MSKHYSFTGFYQQGDKVRLTTSLPVRGMERNLLYDDVFEVVSVPSDNAVICGAPFRYTLRSQNGDLIANVPDYYLTLHCRG